MNKASARDIWWQHLHTPALIFVLLASVLAATRADTAIAHAFFFDAAHMHWRGAGNWWINQFLHTDGRWAIRGIVAIALALWIATYINRNLRELRRAAAFFLVSTVLCIAIVGWLKTITNVDCPWDLAEFGGNYPYIHLFADRPDALRYGHCFPAAHASSGYALFALYFVFRERSRLLSRVGLGVGAVTGLVFGLAQQSRGAHFLSHDVWSAFIAWAVVLSIYAFMFKARLWNCVKQQQQKPLFRQAADEPPAVSDGLVAGWSADQ